MCVFVVRRSTAGASCEGSVLLCGGCDDERGGGKRGRGGVGERERGEERGEREQGEGKREIETLLSSCINTSSTVPPFSSYHRGPYSLYPNLLTELTLL